MRKLFLLLVNTNLSHAMEYCGKNVRRDEIFFSVINVSGEERSKKPKLRTKIIAPKKRMRKVLSIFFIKIPPQNLSRTDTHHSRC